MAIHEILHMGHPVLRQVAEKVSPKEILDPSMKDLISNMAETMKEKQGIGLAAPQIGVSKKIVVIKVPLDSERYPDSEESPLFVLFNPAVTILDEEIQGCWEGCLSVPNLKGYVERPQKIQVDFLDQSAQEQRFIAEGFLAIVFQHELDHLDGIIYIDKLKDTRLLAYCDEYDRYFTEDE